MAITLGLAETKNNFSKVAAEVNSSGKPVTVLRNNKPWVIISPVSSDANSQQDATDVAVDFMDEYSDVFEELAR